MPHFNIDLNSSTGLIGAWIVVPALFLILLTVVLLTITVIHQIKQLNQSKKQAILDNQAESSKKQEQLKEINNETLKEDNKLIDNNKLTDNKDNQKENSPKTELDKQPVSTIEES